MTTDPRLNDTLRDLYEMQPATEIATELVRYDQQIVVMKATVSRPDGGKISAHGSIAPGVADAVEQAESKAVWRALARLGIQPNNEQDEFMPPPGFREHVPPPAAPPPQMIPREEPEQEVQLEDISWTAFWKWAREAGYESKGAVEARIGRPMRDLNPAEVRQLILEKAGA
jgi:hypothetical protein